MPVTTDDLYRFVQLTAEEFPQSAAQDCVDAASGRVAALAPDDGSDRHIRMTSIRERATLNYAASELFASYAVIFFQSQPPIRILNVLNFGAGADSPTPTELLASLRKLSEEYEARADKLLAIAKPITAVIRAGT